MAEEIFQYKMEMEVTADGETLKMNDFVHRIFQGTIKGMISALNVPDDNKEIMLKVKLTK